MALKILNLSASYMRLWSGWILYTFQNTSTRSRRLVSLDNRKKRGSSINLDIHHSKVFSSEIRNKEEFCKTNSNWYHLLNTADSIIPLLTSKHKPDILGWAGPSLYLLKSEVLIIFYKNIQRYDSFSLCIFCTGCHKLLRHSFQHYRSVRNIVDLCILNRYL